VSEARLNIAARLDRVQEHVAELDRRIEAFIKDESAYLIEPEPTCDPDEIRVYITALRNPPMREWAPIISDVVNGLRGSLDNMVWALSISHQKSLSASVPRGRITSSGPFLRWKDIGFPVVDREVDWRGAFMGQLWAIDPALESIFRNVQPFVTGKNRPEREPIRISHELWNINKHRHVSLARVWAGGGETEVRITADPPFEHLKFRTMGVARSGILKLKAKTKLATAVPTFKIAVDFEVPTATRLNMPVNVEHNIPFNIAFKRGYPGFGCLAIETLESVHDAARDLLGRLHSYL
jgi:hypothetical protein